MRFSDPLTMGTTEVVMTKKTSTFDRIDFAKALNDGIKEELLSYPELMGDPERFSLPGEYVAAVRARPVKRVRLSAEEFIDLSRKRDHSHR